MFEVGAGQPVSPHNSIARRSRPAAFDRQSAHTVSQSELCSHHRRRPNAKLMRVGELDLNGGPVIYQSLRKQCVACWEENSFCHRAGSDYQVTGASGGPMSTGWFGDTSATPGIDRSFSISSSLTVPVMEPISSST